jgi:hypothetical protein
MILDTDTPTYGGHGRLDPDQRPVTFAEKINDRDRNVLSLYLPTRTALVLTHDIEY